MKWAYVNLRAQSTHDVADEMKTILLNASTHCSKKGILFKAYVLQGPHLHSLAKPLHKELIVFVLEHALKAMNQIMHTGLAKTDRTGTSFTDLPRLIIMHALRSNKDNSPEIII